MDANQVIGTNSTQIGFTRMDARSSFRGIDRASCSMTRKDRASMSRKDDRASISVKPIWVLLMQLMNRLMSIVCWLLVN